MNKKVLIMAGGTGGHIFPAMAVAKALQQSGVDIHWMGSTGRLEEKIVPREKIAISYIPIKALRGKGIWARLALPWRLLRATFQAWRVIRRESPDVVLGMGGFVSGPGGLAAWMSRTPVVIHEQNAVLGFTNRYLSKFSRVRLQAFSNTFPQKVKPETVGNPIRSEISAIAPPEKRFANREPGKPLHLLVLGGSQGARFLNETVCDLLKLIESESAENASETPPLEIDLWHQTGPLDEKRCRAAIEHLHQHATVSAFIGDMPAAYEWADIVLCRAGALTVSEIAAVGLGAIFVPFPAAVDDHQWYNCQPLCKAGAATAVRQSSLTPQYLKEILTELYHDRQKLLDRAIAARRLAAPEATERVIKQCQQYFS